MKFVLILLATISTAYASGNDNSALGGWGPTFRITEISYGSAFDADESATRKAKIQCYPQGVLTLNMTIKHESWTVEGDGWPDCRFCSGPYTEHLWTATGLFECSKP